MFYSTYYIYARFISLPLSLAPRSRRFAVSRLVKVSLVGLGGGFRPTGVLVHAEMGT